jgi:hypothetical protein
MTGMADDVTSVLDAVDAGRLTAREAVRRLRRRHPAPARAGPTWLTLEVGREPRPLRLGLPLVPLAVALAAFEVVAYPIALVALRVAARAADQPRLRRVASEVPAFPVSRFLAAFLHGGGPVSVEVGGDAGTFRLRLE